MKNNAECRAPGPAAAAFPGPAAARPLGAGDGGRAPAPILPAPCRRRRPAPSPPRLFRAGRGSSGSSASDLERLGPGRRGGSGNSSDARARGCCSRGRRRGPAAARGGLGAGGRRYRHAAALPRALPLAQPPHLHGPQRPGPARLHRQRLPRPQPARGRVRDRTGRAGADNGPGAARSGRARPAERRGTRGPRRGPVPALGQPVRVGERGCRGRGGAAGAAMSPIICGGRGWHKGPSPLTSEGEAGGGPEPRSRARPHKRP